MDLVFLIFLNHIFAFLFNNLKIPSWCAALSSVKFWWKIFAIVPRPPSTSKCDKFRNWKMRISWILNQSLNSLKVLRRIPTSKSQCRKLGNLQTKSWKWNWILSCKNWRSAASKPKYDIQRNRHYRNTSSRPKHMLKNMLNCKNRSKNSKSKY